MGFIETFLPKEDRYAALLLYGMVFCTCFNGECSKCVTSDCADIVVGYDAGIMTVILADTQFTEYYNIDSNRQGVVATIPWASTGIAQLFAGGMLANWLGRIWTLRLSILFMCLGVYA